MYVQIHDTHMYTHIVTKCKAKRVLMMSLFLFNTQNKSFRDRFISILKQSKVLECTQSFYFLITNSEDNRKVHTCTPSHGGE